MTFCKKCGAVLAPEQFYCRTCGCRACDAPAPKVQLPQSNCSKLMAGLLGVFAGGFGVHRFYLGNIPLGILQIAVTFLTLGIGSVWGIVEGILILLGIIKKDAKGNPLAP